MKLRCKAECALLVGIYICAAGETVFAMLTNIFILPAIHIIFSFVSFICEKASDSFYGKRKDETGNFLNIISAVSDVLSFPLSVVWRGAKYLSCINYNVGVSVLSGIFFTVGSVIGYFISRSVIYTLISLVCLAIAIIFYIIHQDNKFTSLIDTIIFVFGVLSLPTSIVAVACIGGFDAIAEANQKRKRAS